MQQSRVYNLNPKSEYRNAKQNKSEIRNEENRYRYIICLKHSNFGFSLFVSDFVLRASDLTCSRINTELLKYNCTIYTLHFTIYSFAYTRRSSF